MTFKSILAACRRADENEVLLQQLAKAALDEGEEEQALPLVESAAARANSPRLWQWAGLLQRGLDEHSEALNSFAKAKTLAPRDPSIAKGYATVAHEAGLDSVDLYKSALELASTDGELLLGLAAARFAIGDGALAAKELDTALRQSPLWLEGHVRLANLRSMLGQRPIAFRSLERAIRARPHELSLWKTLFDLRSRSENFAELDRAVSQAIEVGHTQAAVLPWQTIAAAELGNTEHADRLFAMLPPNLRKAMSPWQIRHLLRTGRADAAAPIIEAALQEPGRAAIWPYASVVWRLTADPRSSWLERNDELISVMDIGQDLPPLPQLAETLRALHVARGEYIDQSVRGGTQTDGPLFSRVDPTIRQLRAAVVAAVQRYVAGMPPRDAYHPLLRGQRSRKVRFSGSWSVRLRGGGRHANHVHPQGWISSALYVSLPSHNDARPQAGWLSLGQPPQELAKGLPPRQMIKPKAGQLALFPSYMWHGTLPFEKGERLTVAFDVRLPY